MKINSKIVYLLVAAFIVIFVLLFVACDTIEDIAGFIWTCVLFPSDKNGCDSVCILGDCSEMTDDYYDWYDDVIDTVIVVVGDCDQIYLRMAAAGGTDRPTYFWLAMEEDNQVLSYSSPIYLDPGEFGGVYVRIPIGGLSLESGEYVFSTYYTEDLQDVGDPKKSFFRMSGIGSVNIPETVVQMAVEKGKGTKNTALSSQAGCMFVSNYWELTIKYLQNPSAIEIIEGFAPTNGVTWQLGGSRASAGELIVRTDSQGNDRWILHALDTVSNFNDFYIFATVSGLSDTLFFEVLSCGDPDCCNWGQKHAGLQMPSQNPADIVGVQAEIYTQYGEKLCGVDGDSVNEAFSCTWISAIYDTVGGLSGSVWAQTGYIKERVPFAGIVYGRYIEVINLPGPSSYYRLDYEYSPPFEYSEHEYRLELDTATLVWKAYQDNLSWDSLGPAWCRPSAKYIQLSSEVLNREDDMSGTAADPTYIWNLEMRTIGNLFTAQTIQSGSLHISNSDTTEWMSDTSGDTLFMWDVNPRQ